MTEAADVALIHRYTGNRSTSSASMRRRISADAVLGLMDLRGLAAPFFFVLRRDRVN